MFIVQEIQTANGKTSLLPAILKEKREDAESAFYMICGSACVSSVPVHSVIVYMHDGVVVRDLVKCFIHENASEEE